MSRPNRPLHPVQCPCGEQFHTTSPSARFCEKCRKLRVRITARHYCLARTGSESKNELRQRIEEDYLAAIGVATSKAAKRCLYCGREVDTKNDFCKACRRENLHYVYEITGRSNGWERRLQVAQIVQPGEEVRGED